MSNVWIPSIEVESAAGVRTVSLATRHLMQRRIFLQGEITSETANDFVSQLLFLEEEGSQPVTIYINSPGGEVNAGLVIYDAIQASHLPISMVCMGRAMSMAAILLAGGQKGRRYVLEHSEVMIHEPLLSNGMGGSATSIKRVSESIMETRSILNGILAKHTGKSVEEINEATGFDNFMNAKEAIAFGLADAVTKTLSL